MTAEEKEARIKEIEHFLPGWDGLIQTTSQNLAIAALHEVTSIRGDSVEKVEKDLEGYKKCRAELNTELENLQS